MDNLDTDIADLAAEIQRAELEIEKLQFELQRDKDKLHTLINKKNAAETKPLNF